MHDIRAKAFINVELSISCSFKKNTSNALEIKIVELIQKKIVKTVIPG